MNTTQLQQTLDFYFNDQRNLLQALAHPSFVNEYPEEVPGSNQRLEFLGDALIGLVIAHELYRSYPDSEEGPLTELRSHIVRGQTLALIARRLGLGKYLLLGQGEAASGGRDRESNLAAALEALVGAMLLDRGYGPSRKFILRVFKSELSETNALGLGKDPKSLLQELTQRHGNQSLRYQLINIDGPPHQRTFTVHALLNNHIQGKGQGVRKVDAEREAAIDALKNLGV